MKYDVCIQETLSKAITVEAESNTDACSMIREKVKNGEIVLSADDYTGCRIITAQKAYGSEDNED